MIYTADKVGAAGSIGAISFYAPTSKTITFDITIYMATQSKTSFASTTDWTPEAELTQVYQNSALAIAAVAGWNTIELETPYYYNGEGSLIIAVSNNTGSYNGTNIRYTTTSDCAMYRRNDNSATYHDYPGTNAGEISSNLPNIKFLIGNPIQVCPNVTNLAISNITATSALVSWAVAEGQTVSAKYGPKDFDPATAGTDLTPTGNSVEIADLAANTEYDFYITASCAEMEGYTAAAGSQKLSFATHCLPITVDAENPYTEGFEEYASASYTTAGIMPSCWTAVTGYSEGFPHIASSSTYVFPHSGTNALCFSGYTGSYGSYYGGATSYAVLPSINNLSDLVLEFWYKMYSSSYGNLTVGYITGEATDMSTFTQIEAIDRTTTLTNKIVNLSSVPEEATYIVFKYNNTETFFSYTCSIDDVVVRTQYTDNDILSFSLANQLSAATIDAENHTINVTVGNGEDVTALIPTMTISENATCNPAIGVSQDFTNPVTYTVTAENGVPQEWVVTVEVSQVQSTECDILSFVIDGVEGVIDGTNINFDVLVTNLPKTAIAPTVTISNYATISTPEAFVSGTTTLDFSNPVEFTITAQDGETTKTYTVTVGMIYCRPNPSNVDANGIGLVRFGVNPVVDNNTETVTGALAKYADYSNLVGGVFAGMSFDVTVIVTSSHYMKRIWIDWNRDGVFDEETELVAGPTADEKTSVITITPPVDAEGNYRMRIGGVDGQDYGPLTPCSEGTWLSFEDYTLQVTVPSCFPANNLVANNVRTTTANISWEASSSNPAEYSFVISETELEDPSAAENIQTIAGTTYDATGLEANHTYYIYVRANCGEEDGNSIWTSASFTTPAFDPATIPYTCDFEDAGENGAWILANGTVANKWFINNATNTYHSGNYLHISDNATGTTYNYNISSGSFVAAYRLISIDEAGDYLINFDWIAGGESSYDYLGAYLVPANIEIPAASTTLPTGLSATAGPAGWINLADREILNLVTELQHNNVSLTVENTGNYNLVFVWRNDGSTGAQPPASVDNISIEKLACMQPADLAVSNITSTSADFSWTNRQGTNVDYLCLTPGTLFDWETIGWSNLDGASVTINELTPNTDYIFYLRTNCDVDGTSEMLSVNFHTACEAINEIPYSENFDSYEATSSASLDPCWVKGTNSTTAYPYPSSYTYYGETGNGLYFYGGGSSNYYSYVALPAFTEDLTNLVVSCQLRQSSIGASYPSMEIGVMTNRNNLATFTSVATLTPQATGTWEAFHTSFASYAGEGGYIAFRFAGGTTTTYAYLDNVVVRYPHDITTIDEFTSVNLVAPGVIDNEANTITATLPGTFGEAAVDFDIVATDQEYVTVKWAEQIDGSYSNLPLSYYIVGSSLPKTFYLKVTAELGEPRIYTVTVDKESCITPSNLVAVQTAELTANLTFEAAGMEAWQYVISNTQLDEAALAAATPQEATNASIDFAVENGNTYYIYLRANCGEGAYSTWASTTLTTWAICQAPQLNTNATAAAQITVTWPEVECYGMEISTCDFSGAIPSSIINDATRPWTIVNGAFKSNGANASTSQFTLIVQGPTTLSFRYKVNSETCCDKFSCLDGTTVLIPEVGANHEDFQTFTTELGAGTHNIVFKYTKDGSVSSNGDMVQIDDLYPIMTPVASAQFLLYRNSEQIAELAPGTTSYVDSELPLGETYCYTAKVVCREGYESALSEASCQTLSDCKAVTNLAYSNVTATSATITWTKAGDETAWNITVNGNTTALTEENVTIDETTVSYELTDLTNGAIYTVGVQTNCGEAQSAVIPEVTFQTNILPTTAPYVYAFEEDLENGRWVTVDNPYTTNNPSKWYVGGTFGTDGSMSAYVSSDNGATNTYTGSKYNVIYAYRTIELEAREYLISFDWKCKGESTYDYLRAFLIPDNATLPLNTAANSTPTAITTTTTPTGWISISNHTNTYLNLPSGTVAWKNSADKLIAVPTAGLYKIAFVWIEDVSNSYDPAASVDNISITPVTCPAVSNITASNITNNSARVSWSETGEAEQWSYVVSTTANLTAAELDANAEMQSAYIDSYAELSDLAGSTTYYVYVRANCSESDNSRWANASFRTVADCPNPTDLDTTALTATSMTIEWQGYHAENWTIQYRPSTVGSWTAEGVVSIENVTTTTYEITDLTPETRYIVRVQAVCSESETSEGYSNQLSVTTPAACAVPTNLVADNVTATSASISWNQFGTPVAYNYILSTSAISSANLVLAEYETATEMPIALSELTPATEYYVYVQAVCDEETTSAWSSVVRFTTECAPEALPFSEDFSGTTFPANSCWKRYSGLFADGVASSTLTTSTKWGRSTSAPFTNGAAEMNVFNTDIKDWLVTPPLAITENQQLTFDLGIRAFNGSARTQSDDKFMVIISADGGNTWNAANATVWSNDGNGNYNYSDITTTGEEVTIPLTAYAGQTIKVAFYGESTQSGDDNYVQVDNILIDVIPTCPKPQELASSNVTATSAEISWTEAGTATEWNYIVSTSVITDFEAATFETTSENPVSLTGLNANTAYYFYVQSACAAEETSEWASTTFRTSCGVSTLPFSEDFTAYSAVASYFTQGQMPACWNHTSSETSYSSKVVSMTGMTGNSLLINANSSTPETVIFPEIDFGTETSVVVSFDYKFGNSISTTYPQTLEFGYYVNNTFTTLTEIEGENTTKANKTLNVDLTAINGGDLEGVQFAYYYTNEFSYSYSSYYVLVDNIVVRTTSAANDILTFTLADALSTEIDAEEHTVTTELRFGADATQQTPTITISDYATISPASGETQDFSAPFIYTVTAENGDAQEWTVVATVSNQASAENDILTFTFPGIMGEATIDNENNTIAATAEWNTNLSNLAPVFTVSNYATSDPESGVEADYSAGATITVTAQNGDEQVWTVNITLDPTACINPIARVTAVEETSATIAWEQRFTETAWTFALYTAPQTQPFSVDALTTSALVDAADDLATTTKTFTGLTPDRDYYFYIHANCGGEMSSWTEWTTVHFATRICEPVVYGEYVDGDGITSVAFGTGENTVNNTTSRDYNTQFTFDFTEQSGDIQAGSEANVNVTVNTSGYYGEYNYQLGIWINWNNDLTFSNSELVYVETAPRGNYTFNANFVIPADVSLGAYRMRIGAIDTTNSAEISDDIYADFGRVYEYVDFATSGGCTDVLYGTYEDYTINVIEAPTCLDIVNFTASNVTSNSATLSWTLIDETQNAWQLVIARDAIADPSTAENIINVNTNTIDVDTLAANTNYYAYARSYCSETEQGNWKDVAFRTECGAMTVPFFEDFEAYNGTTYSTAGIVPDCWTNDADGTIAPHITGSGLYYYPHSGTKVLTFTNGTSYGGVNSYAVLPEFTNQLNSLRMSFWYRMESATSGTLTVGYLTGDQNDMSTYTVIETITGTTTISEAEVNLANVPAEATYLAFRWNHNSSYFSCGIDDINIVEAPSYTITATAEENGTITPNGEVTVYEGADQAFTIVANEGYVISSVIADEVDVTAELVDGVYTFTNVTENHTISASFVEDNTPVYTITATAGDNGTITPAGEVEVFEGENKSFLIRANTGYQIAVVYVDGMNATSQLVSGVYSFTNVTANHTIDAQFVAQGAPEITINNLEDSYIVGDTAQPTISIAANDYIDQLCKVKYTVKKDGEVIENIADFGSIEYSVRLQQNEIFTNNVTNGQGYIAPSIEYGGTTYTVEAFSLGIFESECVNRNRPISVNANFNQIGTYTIDVQVVKAVNTDSTAVADVHTFVCNDVEHTDQVAVNTTDGELIALQSLTITINPVSYTITATAGENGTITPAGDVTVVEGENQEFTIAANQGYQIATVTVDDADVTAELVDGVYTFTNVTANHTINATFVEREIPTFTITATAGENGTITPAGEVVVEEGADQAFNIAANQGYRIATVTVDNADVTAELVDGVYTFTNVTADHTIDATFEVIPEAVTYTITATAGENGTISPAGEVVVEEGADQAFTIAANQGYRIATVTVDNADVTAELVDGVYTFTNVTADHTIDATFEVIPETVTYTITATAGANGTISPAGNVTVEEGADQAFTIAANQGYRIATVTVDNADVTAQLVNGVYTFANVTANHNINATFEAVDTPEPNTYTIIATAGANGTIDPSGVVTVNEGDRITFTFTPDEGFRVATLTVDGENAIDDMTDNAYTFVNVNANHTIDVTFVDVNAVDEIEIATIAAYPNPTNGNFFIDFNNIEGDVVFQLVDARGAMIDYREMNVANGETTRFDYNLRPGTYFVRIITTNNVHVEQLVVE